MYLRRFSLTGVVFLLCAASAPADVLHLRDGSLLKGTILSCDDEVCVLGKKRIPRTDITRISLGTAAVPSVATTPGVILSDGTFKAGTFNDLNRGYVALGDEEIDRKDVAEIILVAAAPRDVLIGAAGEEVQGNLTHCNAASCTFAGETVPLFAIRWLGLGQAGSSPPATSDADLIFVDEDPPVGGRLSGLTGDTVRTTRGSFPRTQVRWIRLAVRAAESGGRPPIIRDPAPPSREDEEPVGDPPPADSPPAPAPPSAPPPPGGLPPPRYGEADENLPRGRLWVGKLIAREWDSTADPRRRLDVDVDVRLREYTRSVLSDPPGRKKVAEIIFLNEEATLVRNTYSSRSQYETCSGEGEATINHPTGIWTSGIYRRTATGAMPRLMTFDIRRDTPFYNLGIGAFYDPMPMLDVRCVTSDGSSNTTMSFHVPMAGTLPGETTAFDPQVRYFDAGRMIGSYTGRGGWLEHATVSWAVCLEGTACPPPAPVDDDNAAAGTGDVPPFDPCARAGQPQALADTCRSQLDLKVMEIEPLFANYNALMSSSEANRPSFEAALNFCELYDAAQQILEAIITGGAGPAAEAARGLLHLRNLIAKVQQGDLPSVLYPSAVKKVIDVYKQAKTVWFELTADEVEKMTRDLNACSGKAPLETYLKAKKFIADLAAARKVWERDVAPAINDLSALGRECATKNHEAWRACLGDAECREETPICGPEPSLDGAYDEQ